MTERQWVVDIERGKLISDDGFYYKVTKPKNSDQRIIKCIGHPMLATSELDLVAHIAEEAYRAYLSFTKACH